MAPKSHIADQNQEPRQDIEKLQAEAGPDGPAIYQETRPGMIERKKKELRKEEEK